MYSSLKNDITLEYKQTTYNIKLQALHDLFLLLTCVKCSNQRIGLDVH